MVKDDLDQDHNLAFIWPLAKKGKWPCLFYHGTLYNLLLVEILENDNNAI